jgi:hypothetical protein
LSRVQSAEADGTAHLAMARHLSAAGDHAAAWESSGCQRGKPSSRAASFLVATCT